MNAATNPADPGPKLKGEWLDLWKAALAVNRHDGAPAPIQRISHKTQELPGFEARPGGVNIRVLGPIESDVAGKAALH